MIKVCIFYKRNDVSRLNIFKKFFECTNSKISLMCYTKTGAVYQNVLDSVWLSGLVVSTLGIRARCPGFESRVA